MYLAMICLALAATPLQADDKPNDRDLALAAHRQQIESVGSSVASLAFTSDETFSSNEPFNKHEYRFAMSDGGRFALKGVATDGETTRLITEVREDGRKLYRIVRDQADEVLDVTIDNAASSAGQYKGIMCAALWAIMPRGKFLNGHLADGATLSIEQVGNRDVVVLDIMEGERQMRCELDPEHDLLVKRMTASANGSIGFELEVERFQLVDGHWFPERGWISSASREGGSMTEKRFQVRDLAVNADLDLKIFTMPETSSKPTKVTDATTRKSTYTEGGVQAYTERNRSVHGSRGAAMTGTEIVAVNTALEQHGWIWIVPYFAGAVCALGLAAIAVRRSLARKDAGKELQTG